jgi:exopolysaccharide biosynthesis polyprenyl glycosylphosphotransferase
MADLLGLAIAFLAAEAFVGGLGAIPINQGLAFTVTLPLWVLAVKVYGLYDRDEERTDHSTVDDLSGVFHLVTVGAWIVYAGSHMAGADHRGLQKVGAFWVLAILLVSCARAFARVLCRRHPTYVQNTVVVGAGAVGETIARKLLRHPEYGINLVGFVDADPPPRLDPAVADVPVLGSPSELREIVRRHSVERVILAFSRSPDSTMLPVLDMLADDDVQIDIVPRLFELIGPNVDIHSVEGTPLLALRPARLAPSSLLIKRGMDVVASACALVLLLPVFVVVAVAIKLDSPGPVFFRQVRVGACGRRFRIWKFRTMVADAEARKLEVAHLNKHLERGSDPRMFKIPNDPRTTSVGRWLRRHSVDELPQLINVLVGQMSLVGPRPLIVEEHSHVRDWAARRSTLKPGITGLWQVLGRDEIPFEEMVKLDFLYVTNWSVGNDLNLVMRTLRVLAAGGEDGERRSLLRAGNVSRLPTDVRRAATSGSSARE